jgi:hypothetical protein
MAHCATKDKQISITPDLIVPAIKVFDRGMIGPQTEPNSEIKCQSYHRPYQLLTKNFLRL